MQLKFVNWEVLLFVIFQPSSSSFAARGVRKVSVARESTSDGAKGYPQWLRKAAPPALVREQAVP